MSVHIESRSIKHPSGHSMRRPLVAASACGAALRRIPFTLGLLGAIWIIAGLTGSLGHGVPEAINHRLGFAPSDLVHGRAYTVLTSVLFIHKRFMFGPLSASLVLFLLPLEWTGGTKRAVAVFWGGHAIETFISGTGVLILAAHGFAAAARLRDMHDVGMSAGTFACAGALVIMAPRRMQAAAAGALATYLLASLVFHRQMYDIDHVLVTPLGAGIGWLLRDRTARTLGHAP